jgi:AcrR family transcriptional regulator
MRRAVKTTPVADRRPYDSSRRQAQTKATRASVIAAARELFLDRGYPATTMAAIGHASGTPMATLYRLFGSKRNVLQQVMNVAFVGDDEPGALHDRPLAVDAAAQTDPAAMLRGYAALARDALSRSAPLHQVLRTAASVDAEAAELLEHNKQERANGQARVVQGLRKRKALRAGLSDRQALDIVYALMSPELHHVLTIDRGWNERQYEQWLGGTLGATLLTEGGRDARPSRARVVQPKGRAAT